MICYNCEAPIYNNGYVVMVPSDIGPTEEKFCDRCYEARMGRDRTDSDWLHWPPGEVINDREFEDLIDLALDNYESFNL